MIKIIITIKRTHGSVIINRQCEPRNRNVYIMSTGKKPDRLSRERIRLVCPFPTRCPSSNPLTTTPVPRARARAQILINSNFVFVCVCICRGPNEIKSLLPSVCSGQYAGVLCVLGLALFGRRVRAVTCNGSTSRPGLESVFEKKER